MNNNKKNNKFPLSSKYLQNYISEWEIDLKNISIRELNRLVDKLSDRFNIKFLQFEFGVPGLKASEIAIDEEINIIKDNPYLASKYPPFDGIIRLKKATSKFVKFFLNINVPSSSCVPTVGAMHGGFICQAIAGRKVEGMDSILYLDPGFPVNKLQTKLLGLKEESIDLYHYSVFPMVDHLIYVAYI